jgi:poly-gamma-glutamate capsule biosynthesis protein CapA/YwtB (metallophosphatase superfamily)
VDVVHGHSSHHARGFEVYKVGRRPLGGMGWVGGLRGAGNSAGTISALALPLAFHAPPCLQGKLILYGAGDLISDYEGITVGG